MDFSNNEVSSNQTFKLESPQSLTLSKLTYDDKFALLVLFAIMIGILFMIGVLYLKDKLNQTNYKSLDPESSQITDDLKLCYKESYFSITCEKEMEPFLPIQNQTDEKISKTEIRFVNNRKYTITTYQDTKDFNDLNFYFDKEETNTSIANNETAFIKFLNILEPQNSVQVQNKNGDCLNELNTKLHNFYNLMRRFMTTIADFCDVAEGCDFSDNIEILEDFNKGMYNINLLTELVNSTFKYFSDDVQLMAQDLQMGAFSGICVEEISDFNDNVTLLNERVNIYNNYVMNLQYLAKAYNDNYTLVEPVSKLCLIQKKSAQNKNLK